MVMRPKAFDCVEMKNRIQAGLFTEYESQKDEFASYLDFINARVKDSELMKSVLEKSHKDDEGKMRERDEIMQIWNRCQYRID